MTVRGHQSCLAADLQPVELEAASTPTGDLARYRCLGIREILLVIERGQTKNSIDAYHASDI